VARWGRLRHNLFRGFPVCVSIAACRAPFPPPAHRTGRADLPHPALRRASPSGPRSRLAAQPSPDRTVASGTLGFSCVARPKPIAIPLPLPTTCPKWGPFARPALPGFIATTGLSATDATGPGPRGLPVAVAAAVVVDFPCFMCIPSIHAVVSTPVEWQSAIVAGFPCHTGLPRMSGGSASTLKVSRPQRAFTCVTACIFAGSPSDPFHRRLRRIRCLLRRFDCYWASDPSRAGLPPARIHTHSRRTNITHL
jgi:hypothetical protein